MTCLAGALLIVLSHDGHWYGGQPQSIRVAWNAETSMPAAVLVWRLDCAQTTLADGRQEFGSDAQPVCITLTPPAVRAATELHWSCDVVGTDDARRLASAERHIKLYPADTLSSLSRTLANHRLLVHGRGDDLSKALGDAGVDTESSTSLDSAALLPPDILLVAPDRTGTDPFVHATLVRLAGAGTTVVMLTQEGPGSLMGYPLVPRRATATLAWRAGHPLLDGLSPETLQRWVEPAQVLWALTLAEDEPALEVAWRPSGSPDPYAGPVDALLVVKRIQAGRLVFCQLPMGCWGRDPRADLLLRNLLDYAVTRPSPTPPRSERRPATRPVTVELPVVTIPAGVQP